MSELVLRSRYTLAPVPRVTLSHQILSALEKNPDHLAIVDGVTGTRTTRGQLADQVGVGPVRRKRFYRDCSEVVLFQVYSNRPL